MAELEFTSVVKFFVFLLIGVSMLVGLDANYGIADGQFYSTYHSMTTMLSSGYTMLAIGCVIIGLAAALKFTDYI